jgi:hypothetical protein
MAIEQISLQKNKYLITWEGGIIGESRRKNGGDEHETHCNFLANTECCHIIGNIQQEVN